MFCWHRGTFSMGQSRRSSSTQLKLLCSGCWPVSGLVLVWCWGLHGLWTNVGGKGASALSPTGVVTPWNQTQNGQNEHFSSQRQIWRGKKKWTKLWSDADRSAFAFPVLEWAGQAGLVLARSQRAVDGLAHSSRCGDTGLNSMCCYGSRHRTLVEDEQQSVWQGSGIFPSYTEINFHWLFFHSYQWYFWQ